MCDGSVSVLRKEVASLRSEISYLSHQLLRLLASFNVSHCDCIHCQHILIREIAAGFQHQQQVPNLNDAAEEVDTWLTSANGSKIQEEDEGDKEAEAEMKVEGAELDAEEGGLEDLNLHAPLSDSPGDQSVSSGSVEPRMSLVAEDSPGCSSAAFPTCADFYKQRRASCEDKLTVNVTNYKQTKGFCEVCRKWVCQLRQHMLVHSGEKPYQCRFCSRTFNDKSNRNKHIKSAHGGGSFSPRRRLLHQ